MICSKDDTDEGREQGKVNTEAKRKHKGIFMLPFAVALPVVAVIAAAAFRAWPKVQKLLGLLVRAAVKP